MSSSSCPCEEQLARLLDGESPSPTIERLRAHVRVCPRCAGIVLTESVLGDSSQPSSGRSRRPILEQGARVGRYGVGENIGAGSMGVVYRAFDPLLERQVALKLVAPQAGRETDDLLHEARVLARIDHPNVATIYDAGIHETLVFIVMELVQGAHLGRWIDERRRDWQEIVDVFIAAGRGLAAIHRAGFVHRDIKPANLLIDSARRVRIVDLGLATGAQEPSPPRVAGTWAYMAPEQRRGLISSASGDQFSLCISLAEALCGERLGLEQGGVPWPSPPGVPSTVWQIVTKGLAPRAAQRWPSVDSLVDALVQMPRSARVG